jgi:predicted DNA-binding antitoxin AbrB/MazE fold protein
VRSIEARYEDGVLKLAHPVALQAGDRVRLIVLREPDKSRWDLARLASATTEDELLAKEGLAEWSDTLDAEERAKKRGTKLPDDRADPEDEARPRR